MWGTTTSGTGDGYAGKLFQSTPPRGGATQATKDADSTTDISIHVPHAGATGKAHKFGWHFCSKQRRFPGSILLQGYYTGYFFRKQLCCGGILGAKGLGAWGSHGLVRSSAAPPSCPGVGGDSGHQRRRPVYFLAASCVMLTLSLL